MSVFYQQILQYLSNVIKKRLGGPQKMPSKLCKLCNVSKIQLKTYVKCVYALINQLICITNNVSHQRGEFDRPGERSPE